MSLPAIIQFVEYLHKCKWNFIVVLFFNHINARASGCLHLILYSVHVRKKMFCECEREKEWERDAERKIEGQRTT